MFCSEVSESEKEKNLMRIFYPFPVKDIDAFKLQLLETSNLVKHFCYLDANKYPDYPHSTFGSFIAIDSIDSITVNENCFAQFQEFQQLHQDWMFGFLNYDLKNEIEIELKKTDSKKTDSLQNPLLHFFIPKYLIKIENEDIEIGIVSEHEDQAQFQLKEFEQFINNKQIPATQKDILNQKLKIKHRIKKEDYISTIEKIKLHIQRGDIYEMNFCQEFYVEDSTIDALASFNNLNMISKAPFTCFFKNKSNYLMCASPERFLKKQQNKLISQPIKGTRKRMPNAVDDKISKDELLHSEKERSENVMIVDLVRNDFSKIAIKNTVVVEELFGIYTFEQVHQMISTITCEIEDKIQITDIFKAVFPMGSMTGAPKISAMQLIEQFESKKRGLYSGAVGYITPKGNFDFNVVIRSILYNDDKKYTSIQAGSAITMDADASHEYEECLLKAKAMLEALV